MLAEVLHGQPDPRPLRIAVVRCEEVEEAAREVDGEESDLQTTLLHQKKKKLKNTGLVVLPSLLTEMIFEHRTQT